MFNEESISLVQARIKDSLQESPLYENIIMQCQSFMSSLSSNQKRLILKGRNSEQFKSLESCSTNSFISKKKCIQGVLESNCEDRIRTISKCMLSNSKTEDKCNFEIENYIMCLRKAGKRFYMSTVLSY